MARRYYNMFKPSTQPRIKTNKDFDREGWEKIRSEILLRDHFRCQECGYYKHLEVHHIIPRSEGGSDDPANLTTLCRKCHGKKHGFKNGRILEIEEEDVIIERKKRDG